MNVTGVVLAAGAGRRMGRPKADIRVGGTSLLVRALGVLADAGCSPRIAVLRPGASIPPPDDTGLQVVTNPDPDRGMRSSLRVGIEAAPPGPVAVMLVDSPGIDVAAARSVIQAWRPGRIAVANYGGRRAHPVVAPTLIWQAALALAGPDEGARALMAAHPEWIDDVPVEGDPTDLDTQADLDAWLRAGE